MLITAATVLYVLHIHLLSNAFQFISLQMLLGKRRHGGARVCGLSPSLQFVLNYLRSVLQLPRQWDGQLQTVPGTGLFLTVKEVIAGVCRHAEVRTVTQTFH